MLPVKTIVFANKGAGKLFPCWELEGEPLEERRLIMADIFDEVNEIEFETVTMTDENGMEVEFSIIDNVACGGERYLLVVETELMDDDETDAIILKEVSINTDDVTYELVEDDAEFDRVADLFSQKAEDYTVEMD